MKTGFFKCYYRYAIKQFFFRKLPDIAIVPYHAETFQKILNSRHEMQSFIILGQFWPELPIFPKKKFFGKFKYPIYLRVVPLILLKISQIWIEWIMRYKVA